uniref:Uncharacterized protein n=1 Tax=Rhizophora mucronata TaxID=61149 RepID=A0A2P2R3K8_RHIMU
MALTSLIKAAYILQLSMHYLCLEVAHESKV